MQEGPAGGRVYRSEHARRTADPAPTPDRRTDDELGGAAGNSAVMALGSLVSRMTGFLRTVMIGAALGSTVAGNAYTTAQWFPGMVYELLLGGILTSVLVPVLVRARRSDPDRGEAYTQRLVTLAVLALGVTTVLAVAAAPLLAALLVAPTDSRELVTALSYLMLPTIFFYGMAGLLTAVLNSRGHFAAPMWAPILNNLVVIATFGLYLVIFTGDQMSPGKVLLAGGGTLLGIVAQASGLLPALRGVGFRFRWRAGFAALRLPELGRLAGWMFCYIGMNQVAVVIVVRLLSEASADPDNPGLLIYNNVFLLLMMAHGIVGVSIIMALLPRMSAAAADRRYADVVDDLSKGARMAAAVLAPVAVGYAVLATPISVTLFQFGAFDAADAAGMAPVLLVTGLALIPFSLGQLGTFTFYALQDTRTPALVNAGVVAVRIGVQVAVFAAFAASFAAAGMMLGNGVSYLVSVVVLSWLLRRRLGSLRLWQIGSSVGRVLIAAAGAALAGLLVRWLLPGGAEPSKLDAAIELVAGGLVIGGSYLGLAVLLRIREVHEVLALIRNRIRRG